MIYEIIISSIFIIWFIATIIVQFRNSKLEQIIKPHDQLALLPLWTFFAPNPGVNDYHLLYREDYEDGSRSAWQEIEINEKRSFSTCFWNPSKRGKKVISDVIQTIIPLITRYKDNPRALMFSLPYVLILNTIMKEKFVLTESKRRQFVLTATSGYEESEDPKIVLVSEFHPIS